MKRIFAAAMFLLSASIGAASADTPVLLRPTVQSEGAAITLGDVFEGAGAVAPRAVAPAPGPGRSTQLSVPFLVAAAEAAGLTWTPPEGLNVVTVSGRAVRPHPLRTDAAASATAPSLVRRGETLTLVYVAPGMQLTARARAMQNGDVGDVIRVSNLQSNTIVEATITGPGAASASVQH